MTTRRGASNGNSAGSAEDRRRRRAWLLETYRADVDVLFTSDGRQIEVHLDAHLEYDNTVKVCRCYRCGKLLTLVTLTVDRIVPGCRGGTYRRTNIRPACSDCNSTTGGAQRSLRAKRERKLAA